MRSYAGRIHYLSLYLQKVASEHEKKAENYHSKRQKIGSNAHFPALYVIINVSPNPPCTCPIHTFNPNFKTLTPLFNPPPPVGIGTKHSKIQKIGSGEIAAGVAIVLVALCSGNKYIRK